MPLPEGGEFQPDDDEYGDYGPVITDPEPAAPQPEPAAVPPMEDGYGTFDVAQTQVGLEPEPLLNDKGEALPTFDNKHAEAFVGLMYMGALTKTFSWQGHRFHIRTLTVDEELAVAVLTKQYQGTLGEMKAYAVAVAALSVVSIDQKPLPSPIGPTEDGYAWAFQKFDYARTHWFMFTIDRIYQEYIGLEQTTTEVVRAMEKASGQAASTPGSNTNSE